MSELTKKEKRISSEDYEKLLKKYQFNAKELAPGKLLRGKVVKITSSYILVDVGFKSEGIIPAEDFDNQQEIKKIHLGDEIEAVLERGNLKEGYLILSKKRALAINALNNLEKALNLDTWIIGKITKKIKTGYIVNVGINTFLPDSHADVRTIKEPEKLIGNRHKFKVIKFDRKNENAVLSRKLLLQDEKEKRKKHVFKQLRRDKKIKGKVKSITSFGAFIDIGGMEGLLHISNMSWGKTNHPSEYFQIGQEIEVVVLDFNEKEEKISLGYKQLSPNPWENIEKKYLIGQKTKGKVVNLTDFGAFIELEKGVEGLVHISDLTWSRKLIHPKKVLSIGEEVNVTILDIIPAKKRISLGIKQVTPHPLEVFRQKFSPGSRIKGKITNITDFGAFMEVEDGIEGLIHISDISWKKIKHPSQELKVGQDVEAVILNIDIEKQKLGMGIKQLEGDIWEDFFSREKIGNLVKAKIIRLTNFGVFVEITPGIEGVVFLSELDEKKIEDPAEFFSLREEKLAKIIKLNQKDKKISLSFRQARIETQKLEYQKYMQRQDNRMTLGDVMKDKFKNIESSKNNSTKKEDKEDKKKKKNQIENKVKKKNKKEGKNDKS
ncbi:MAG: 30S ribosomal protein S1 [Acidobacteriota bacterium]|nr:30S ribosomal protein S1 [Acidobacteriota bacterium]